MVTPAVDVVRVALITDSFAQPLFAMVTLRSTHSLRLMTPFPLPAAVSLTETAPNSSFELPVLQKSCVTTPSVGTITLTVAVALAAQLRWTPAAGAGRGASRSAPAPGTAASAATPAHWLPARVRLS